MAASSVAADEIVRRCLESSSDAAWTEFVRHFQPVMASSICRVLRRYGNVSAALVDDLIQETYIRICKDNCRYLREFEARHDEAILAYIRVIAASVALDYFRARLTAKRRAEVDESTGDPDASISPGSIEQSALIREVDQLLARTESVRDRTIFWLYYRQGYTAKDIASISGLGLSQKGVESCIYRLTQLLRSLVNATSTSPPRQKGNLPENTLGVIK